MARTPQEIFEHHATVLIAGDIEGIVADYADDALIITPQGVLRGKDGVREAFTTLLGEVPDADWDVPHPDLRGRHPLHPVVGGLGEVQDPGRRRHLRLP
jgi:hypothetical protein